MGVHARVQVPHLLPPVLAALADSKPNLRQAAITVINTFLKVRSSTSIALIPYHTVLVHSRQQPS
jgi:hypothetical protein